MVRAAILVMLGLGSALGLVEAGLRALDLTSEPRRFFRPGIFVADAVLGWALKPSYRGVRLQYDKRVPTSTNPLGFRGPRWDETRGRAGLRVLVLGDSCAFGLGVADGETYPAQLEAILKLDGRSAAVFNAGVPGYDTEQEAALLRQLAPVVRPNVVVVTWLLNDLILSRDSRSLIQVEDGYLVHDLEHYRAWRDRVDHRGLYRSALYRFVRVRLKLLRASIGMGRGRSFQVIEPEQLRSGVEALLDIRDQTDALGARLVLVLLPRRERVENNDSDLSHLRYLADLGRARGMDVVSPVASWREDPAAIDRYLPGDKVHFTARGYRDVARAVAMTPALHAP